MPKAPKQKHYHASDAVVSTDKERLKIHHSWNEAKQNVSHCTSSLIQVEDWLGEGQEQALDDMATMSCRFPTPTTSPPVESDPESTIPIGFTDSEDVSPSVNAAVPAEPTIHLSPEQQHIFNTVKAGKSIFFTGAAGTGKSVLLREIIKWCRGEGKKKLAVTASTGIASVNIGGSTLHSWAGIGLGKEKAELLVGKILGLDRDKYKKYNRLKEMEDRRKSGLPPNEEDYWTYDNGKPKLIERWRSVEVLIVDEISMIDGALFDKLEFVARLVRRSQKPFGGIQLVLSGDFCQLPPIGDKSSRTSPAFAFDANAWVTCVGKPITLRKVFRQKEQVFVDMLNSMRLGQLDSLAIEAFRRLSRDVVYNDGLDPTELFATRIEVENANIGRLSVIQEREYSYLASDFQGWDETGQLTSPGMMDKVLSNLVAQKRLTFKVGAQVMLIKNLVQGQFVNGSIGRITGFATARDALNCGIWIGIPDGIGDKDQPQIELLEKEDIEIDNNSAALAAIREHMKSGNFWPIVEFSNCRKALCIPLQFEMSNAEGVPEAIRDQVPLILAWALNIHKSQGQTLERVRVDLNRIFENGQAYVALSRATSMERLQVLNFTPAKVMVHERVLEWMKEHGGVPNSVGFASSMDDTDEELEYWANDPWGDDFSCLGDDFDI